MKGDVLFPIGPDREVWHEGKYEGVSEWQGETLIVYFWPADSWVPVEGERLEFWRVDDRP